MCRCPLFALVGECVAVSRVSCGPGSPRAPLPTATRCTPTHAFLLLSHPMLQAFPGRMLQAGLAGLLALPGGIRGVLLPARHPATQELLLQLALMQA